MSVRLAVVPPTGAKLPTVTQGSGAVPCRASSAWPWRSRSSTRTPGAATGC